MWPSVIQYVVNLLTGCFLFLVMAAYMSVSAGISTFGLFLIVTPLILGGFCSGVGLFTPKVSAVASIVCVSPFLYAGIKQIIDPSPATDSITFVIPSAFVIFASVITLLWSSGSPWAVRKTTLGKVAMVVLAAPPALFSSYVLIHMVLFILGYL